MLPANLQDIVLRPNDDIELRFTTFDAPWGGMGTFLKLKADRAQTDNILQNRPIILEDLVIVVSISEVTRPPFILEAEVMDENMAAVSVEATSSVYILTGTLLDFERIPAFADSLFSLP